MSNIVEIITNMGGDNKSQLQMGKFKITLHLLLLKINEGCFYVLWKGWKGHSKNVEKEHQAMIAAQNQMNVNKNQSIWDASNEGSIISEMGPFQGEEEETRKYNIDFRPTPVQKFQRKKVVLYGPEDVKEHDSLDETDIHDMTDGVIADSSKDGHADPSMFKPHYPGK